MALYRPAILATALVAMLAGCGDKTATTPQADDTQPPPRVPTQAANPWMPDCKANIVAIESAIASLEKSAPPYTVATVLEPLNAIETRIADGSSLASLMENVHPDSNVREHAASCTTGYADIASRLSLSRGIYDAVSQVDASAAPADTQRYLEVTLKAFKLSGVDKDEATRAKIRDLNDRITQLGQTFDRNILEDVRYIEVSPEQLAGMPEDFIAGKTPQANGNIRISTRYVDSIPVYTYAHSDEVRKQLRQVDQSRGYPQNEQVLKELLSLRHELARLLGFDNYADLITNDKMIGSASAAQDFIDRIHTLAEPAAKADLARLLARLQKFDPKATQVERWQAFYLEEQIRREDYQVNADELRQYFPYQKVKNGVFALVEHLFDVRIVPWQTETWHQSVESYEMYQGDTLVGRFHMDMHPREGKYQHAAAFTNNVGIAGKQLPVATLVCNFAGGNDPMEAMEYAEVRTFLHEFGHLLHSLFGGHQRWARASGIATEWDFVEAPSQMLEEWMYDKDTLQSFAINSDGQAIPDDVVAKLRAAREFGEGVDTAVQMYYAALSLNYHRLDPSQFSLVDKMIELESHYSPFPHQEDTYFFASLGHLNGYSAIYYTYMWSKVIAIDMFSEFEAHGLRDKATAQRYRDTILAPGGAKPAAQLVADFMGRPYSFEAFAKRLKAGGK